ncbi:MAG TPA: methyltransferase domain-containing protein [Candidatus Accumulibacter phosphatis]|nr:hypothetical protein [Accumulibacter sp.]HCN68682.1 hypothetical protein [Accumulibacter sp.]HRL78149.1 methyltransferase domain-containing protein [Candidatus Accumulibacter phosphatis]HRQ96702.1 methyltransferase domain-containing protein [Candidatus Accumulibacter phosphatis]
MAFYDEPSLKEWENTMRIEQLSWDIDFIRNATSFRKPDFGIPEKAKEVAYPFRIKRYWFMYHLLKREAHLRGAPLDVCEIGVDRGQMLYFMQAAQQASRGPVAWEKWTAVDCRLRKDILAGNGYADMVESNIEFAAPKLQWRYDALILLHVLEHLNEPEAALHRLTPLVKPGGIVIGGFPVTPEPFRKWRQDKLRQMTKPFGHVSVFSPKRVREMAETCDLKVEFLSGAFFMRKKGFFLENAASWWRFNSGFGSLFPGWPGEIYWLFRKPAPAALQTREGNWQNGHFTDT